MFYHIFGDSRINGVLHRVLLGHFWSTFGALLEYFWGTFRVLLGHFLSTFGAPLEYFCSIFGVLLPSTFGVFLEYVLLKYCGDILWNTFELPTAVLTAKIEVSVQKI